MKAIIIIDMLNGFCRENHPLSLQSYEISIENYIESSIQDYLNKHNEVIFVCDSHNLDDPEIDNPYPPHCLIGTEEAEIIDILKKYTSRAKILTKSTLSIFYNTGLDKLLEKINPSEVEVTGVCTDICVLFAVYELRIRGYNVYVSNKGVLPLDSSKQNEFLEYFENRLGARIDYK